MRKLFALMVFVFGFTAMQAQMAIPGLEPGESPVKWTGKVEKKSDNSYDLIFQAEIKKNWHIFSQWTPDGGSLPLEIEYLDNSVSYQTNGETKESPTKTQYNTTFKVDEMIWEDEAVLTQNITLINPDQRYIKAEMFYQVCDEVCINEEYYFAFDLRDRTGKIFKNYDDFQAFGGDAAIAKVATSSNIPDEPVAVSESELDFGDPMSAMGFGAQPNIKSPVDWTADVTKNEDNSYDLTFKAKIKDRWHIFSQWTPEGGSLPMMIEYLDDSVGYQTNGDTQESPTKRQFNDTFGVDELIWENEAVLTQNITLTDADVRYIKADMRYQVCDEVCINEEYYFVFDLKDEVGKVFKNYDEFEAYGTAAAVTTAGTTTIDFSVSSDSPESERSLAMVFFLAFLWGFAALLTPCVFPMIPMTVSFFIKQSKTKAVGRRNAVLYGVFIILIYVLLGSLVTAIFGADSLNAISTNVTFNIVFFLILLVFAASFLGAFEIVLPSSWANKVDRQADRGGIMGIFFMALALAIVSFSCTGPIIGTLLVQASSQGGVAPIIGMLGFSFALAIPFGLFALFPSWMNTLPKSGGWLNSVKVVLGLLELAFAFKFLSNADLVLQAGILPRELFIAIWIAIFGFMAFYLFGKIQLPNDTKPTHISVGRLGMGLLSLTFTIYLIPGIWGAPLKLISGFPPPMTYSESPYGVGYTKTGGGVFSPDQNLEIPEGAIPGPHDILAFRDYEQGMEYARKIGKPVLLDFTGWACVNCRKMEERIWSEPQILSILKNDVVLISLYVDMDEKLPKEEQYTSPTTGKRIRTIGNKWSDFQIKHFQMNAQPYYVLMSPENSANLNDPVGYLPDPNKYESWLRDGIGKYKTPEMPYVAR